MTMDARNYRIVWDLLPAKAIRAATRRGLPRLAPYFVAGERTGRVDAEQPLVLEAGMLFDGVLHEWLAPRPGPVEPSRWRRNVRLLLEDLRASSGFGSLELMTLVHATRVREQCGHLPAMKMLMTAQQCLPRSSEIRSDLILDIWALVEAAPGIDLDSAFTLIRELYEGVRFEALHEDVADYLDYANFVALTHLGEQERRNRLFWRVVSKRMRHPGLKARMIGLLDARAQPSHGLPNARSPLMPPSGWRQTLM